MDAALCFDSDILFDRDCVLETDDAGEDPPLGVVVAGVEDDVCTDMALGNVFCCPWSKYVLDMMYYYLNERREMRELKELEM